MSPERGNNGICERYVRAAQGHARFYHNVWVSHELFWPGHVALPALGARVTKVGRGYQLRLIERQPGDYIVRLRVGRGGFVEAILDENISDDDAA
jgi:hypothetical protein